MTRLLPGVALAALLAVPVAASAQSPKPSPAIKNTQGGINNAKSKISHTQAKSKKGAQAVGSGGAHPDSEVPNNPGESSNKPGSGPGMAGGSGGK